MTIELVRVFGKCVECGKVTSYNISLSPSFNESGLLDTSYIKNNIYLK